MIEGKKESASASSSASANICSLPRETIEALKLCHRILYLYQRLEQDKTDIMRWKLALESGQRKRGRNWIITFLILCFSLMIFLLTSTLAFQPFWINFIIAVICSSGVIVGGSCICSKIIQEKKQKQNIAKLQRDVALVERQLHDSKERFTNLLKTCEKEHIKEANESKEVQAVLEDDLKAYQTFLNDQLDSCQEVSGKRKTLTK